MPGSDERPAKRVCFQVDGSCAADAPPAADAAAVSCMAAAAPAGATGDEDADLLAGLGDSDGEEEQDAPKQQSTMVQLVNADLAAAAAAGSREGGHGACGLAAAVVAPGGAETLMALVGQYDEHEIVLDDEEE
jgi:hypothetical protein